MPACGVGADEDGGKDTEVFAATWVGPTPAGSGSPVCPACACAFAIFLSSFCKVRRRGACSVDRMMYGEALGRSHH